MTTQIYAIDNLERLSKQLWLYQLETDEMLIKRIKESLNDNRRKN